MVKSLLQIVPTLTPSVSGVGDYALSLAKALRSEHGVQTSFIVGNPAWPGGHEIEGFAVQKVATQTPAGLLATLAGHSLPTVLHYTGYEYARTGTPNWVATGLQQWRQEHRDPFLTMFHELNASGPIWKKAFWSARGQRRIIETLMRISTRCLTSNDAYAERLVQLDANSRPSQDWLTVLPIFSSFGEPKSFTPFAERLPQAIVFGTLGRRQLLYKHWQDFQPYGEQLGIETIIDIGPGQPDFGSIPHIKAYGILEPSHIAALLSESKIGLLRQSPTLLGKSSVFAAYAAHGLATLVLPGQNQQVPRSEENFYIYLGHRPSYDQVLTTLAATAQHAYDWYQPHSLALSTRFFLPTSLRSSP